MGRRLRDASLGRACDGSAGDVDRFLDLDAIFPRDRAAAGAFRSAVVRAHLDPAGALAL